MSEHTPGPWNVHVRSSDGTVMVTSESSSLSVANVTDYGEMPSLENARLIAAAPDLLSACELVLSRLDYLTTLWGQEGVTRGVRDKLHAAIAQAKG